MLNSNLTPFANQQYLNLETCRKNGQAVRTPVWFVQDGDVLNLYSLAGAEKVKRVRNTSLDQKYDEAMAQFRQRNNLQTVNWDTIEIRV